VIEIETDFFDGLGYLLGIQFWRCGLANRNFMIGRGIGDLDFRGFRSGLVGFNGEGVIPLGGKIDLRSGLGFRRMRCRRDWLVVLINALVGLLIGDDGEFQFFRGLGWSRGPRGRGGFDGNFFWSRFCQSRQIDN
jgi:hypothetical protein